MEAKTNKLDDLCDYDVIKQFDWPSTEWYNEAKTLFPLFLPYYQVERQSAYVK